MITDSETSNRHYSVGERIQVQGESATIRYIGPVEGKVGTWLGVEWDDPSRGKHGGTFNGQTYFTTLAALRADPSGCSVTAGSFLSASKAGITIGQSVLAALSQKYHSEQPIDGTVAFGGDTAITVETVGWDKIKGKQSHLENVTTLGLAGLCISFCGTDPAELDSVRRSCVSVTDLDLSRNLLSRWTDVANIVDLMPMLKLLRLSVNRFVSADETLPPTKSVLNPHDSAKTCDVDLAQSFSGISQMALMSTMMSWADVEHIEPWFANLQELYLGSNHIKSLVGTSSLPLPDFVTGFVHLTVLSLENNSISHWSQVQRLGKLPNLKNLNLAGNQLKSIEIDKEDPIEPMFAQLTTLSLHHNLIDTWTSIHALNSLPKLAEVRLTLNPITSLDLSGRPSSTERTSAAQGTDAPSLSSSMFWILVGRLARVTQLNGSQITQRDRLNGEMYYLSESAKDLATFNHDRTAFHTMHPRYEALCAAHGTPTSLPAHFLSNALKDRLLKLKLRHCETDRVVEKRLPATMSVSSVKSLMIRLFKLSDSCGHLEANLVWISVEDGRSETLTDELKELAYYDMVNGDLLEISL